ncbi:MAG: glycosyltransferase family 1 protein [Chitinophagales bacterium]|nr:glycosyltransferase family 1 protein [Chitinophagales bacterium]
MSDNIYSIPLICFSHLRWDFVYQRPQHILSRFAASQPVFYFEEPLLNEQESYLEVSRREHNLTIVRPHLNVSSSCSEEEISETQRRLLDRWLFEEIGEQFILWYYTPMALLFSDHLQPRLLIYDCMDELSAFRFAPSHLKLMEHELLRRADLVFTGGFSLFESRKNSSQNIFLFPSSVDKKHFHCARSISDEPEDQAVIRGPKAGYAGVIDERLDVKLLYEMATLSPQWSFIMIGPVVKINPEILPKSNNIFYLGKKSYHDLPAYMSGWRFGLLPFALNESTQFISPTKTPEYLAAGLQVISTPIKDVIDTYANKELIRIGRTGDEFSSILNQSTDELVDAAWAKKVDAFIEQNSWDATWKKMNDLMLRAFQNKSVKIKHYEV